MSRKIIICLLTGSLMCIAPFAEAQQPKKVPRIGYLSLTTSPRGPDAFLQGLRDLGYIEGQNIVIEYRDAAGRAERLPDLAAELVRLKVDVIVAGASQSTRAAKQATKTIAVVFHGVGDPVAQGIVDSLARPGGNITEVGGKRLELLKEVVPTASRVVVLWNPTNSSNSLQLKEIRTAAQTLAFRVQSLEVSKPDDIDRAFTSISREGADALLVFADPFLSSQSNRIFDLATKNRLPAMYGQSDPVEAGGLMSYAPSFREFGRRAAYYVDKILKGTKPADLPVEQPTKFVVNLKAAKQIGLTIPPNVLARADKVIK
jgi:putative tryptophan/tyrosine transport system substrate-binding protein